MNLYIGATSYEIYPSVRTAGAWNVNVVQERFDLLRFRRTPSPHGCCVIRDVPEADARQWAAANPISNPQGWARLREVLDHYGFRIRFRLGLAD